jgi:multicomponent Na+:H+ antiporter subunit E
MKEIVVSNLAVAKVILSPSLPIHPRIVRVAGKQKTPIGQVIYANSITLTPGTVTLDVRDDKFLVHALTSDSAAGLLSGEMDERVARLEGGGGA